MDTDKFVLIPSYEPDSRLVELTNELHKAGMKIIVIDDGSGENYRQIFEEVSANAVVLKHTENLGKGRALKTGFQYILKHGMENCAVVTMDSDGQHTVSDAKRLCGYVADHQDSLVLGSRELGKDIPLRSRIGNTVTRAVFRISTGIRLHDTQTGLRAFSTKLLPMMLKIKGERYEYEMNVLLECAKRNVPIIESKIETIYFDNNAGSHFDTVKDSARVYGEILKFSLSSFISFLLDYGVFTLLTFAAFGLPASESVLLSNVGARVISSGANYMLNRNVVFKSRGNAVKSAAEYFALAAVILLGNTLLLSFLTVNLGIDRFAAKLITEAFFFAVSWFTQKLVIFRRKEISA